MTTANSTDPHAGQPVLRAGPPVSEARLVAILIHGRGASAEDILGLAQELRAKDVAYLAPQAANHSWYPYSFLAPIPQNEPGITSGLQVIAGLIDDVARAGVQAGSPGADGLFARCLPVARVRGPPRAAVTPPWPG